MGFGVSWVCMKQWVKYWEENKLQVILGLLGLFFLICGLAAIFSGVKGPKASVEIISVDEGTSEGQNLIMVDVAGAVEKPGVYELEENSRINDALVAAGGFSEDADRIWVRRYVNLAQKIPDGSKLYIPVKGEMVGEESNSGVRNEVGLININTASISQLDELWGIGEARARAIIEARPYSNIEEIKEKASIPSNVFDKIKDQISVF